MAGEADQGGAAADPQDEPNALILKLIDDQLERLCREGPQEGALAAGRVASAARSLVMARATIRKDAHAAAEASVSPPEPMGETLFDERLLPPDHPERVAARAAIVRGFRRVRERRGDRADPAGDAVSGRTADPALAASVGGGGPDTS